MCANVQINIIVCICDCVVNLTILWHIIVLILSQPFVISGSLVVPQPLTRVMSTGPTGVRIGRILPVKLTVSRSAVMAGRQRFRVVLGMTGTRNSRLPLLTEKWKEAIPTADIHQGNHLASQTVKMHAHPRNKPSLTNQIWLISTWEARMSVADHRQLLLSRPRTTVGMSRSGPRSMMTIGNRLSRESLMEALLQRRRENNNTS